MVVGLLFVVIGVIYLFKPTLFRRGIWLKTSIAIRTLSEENYIRYMRIVGVLMILAGLVFIVRALV
jgi:uncharacterized protein YjeT (DUF2065 family)